MQSKSFSNPEIKLASLKKTKRFQQDYQTEENLEKLKVYLTDSEIKESQNKQKLYQSKRENEALREQLRELEANRKKLEVAKDINQKFFKKYESEIVSLRKPLEDQSIFTEMFSNDSHEALRKKIKETQQSNREELDVILERQPKYEEILQTSDASLSKILELLKGQVMIFKEEMTQKEKSYRHMQDRFQSEFDVLSEQHNNIKTQILLMNNTKKQDMKKKFSLERKIGYLEADVELGNGFVDAQKLALSAAQEINLKIQKADRNNSLNDLNSRIQQRIAATKPI